MVFGRKWSRCNWLTNVKLLGDAAQRFTVVSGHVFRICKEKKYHSHSRGCNSREINGKSPVWHIHAKASFLYWSIHKRCHKRSSRYTIHRIPNLRTLHNEGGLSDWVVILGRCKLLRKERHVRGVFVPIWRDAIRGWATCSVNRTRKRSDSANDWSMFLKYSCHCAPKTGTRST